MKILHGENIAAGLRSVNACKIAVAFVGKDWQSFVDVGSIDDIIISPTFGSNPRAVRDLARKIGWEKLHFLDNLHAKMFLGKTSAAVGSFNLTNNGIGQDGLDEAGVLVTDRKSLADLGAIFEKLIGAAKQQYPTTKKKQQQLALLERQWNLAAAAGIRLHDAGKTDFLDYVPLLKHDFFVLWYQSTDIEYNRETVAVAEPSLSTDDIDDKIVNAINLLESDQVLEGSWLLLWKAKQDGTPGRPRPYWMHAHRVISHGALHQDPYSKVAIEIKGLKKLSPPFELDDSFIDAFKCTLASGEFPEFLMPGDDSDWGVSAMGPRLKEFVEAIKVRMSE